MEALTLTPILLYQRNVLLCSPILPHKKVDRGDGAYGRSRNICTNVENENCELQLQAGSWTSLHRPDIPGRWEAHATVDLSRAQNPGSRSILLARCLLFPSCVFVNRLTEAFPLPLRLPTLQAVRSMTET